MATPSPDYFVYFGPDANCTLALCPVERSVYQYRPSLGANLAFMILYFVAMVIHIVLGIRWKSWWFMACIIAGCVDEIIGYVGRVLLFYNPWSFAAFMMQIVCITTGPVFYCAAIYVVLAQTINHFSPSLSRFPPKLFYWIFIPCDIVSLILQGAGGGMSTTSSGTSQTGVNLALAGLSFQVFTLVVFVALFLDYLVQYFRSGAAASFGIRMKLFFGFTTLAIVLILARCCYRVDELSEGYSGPLISNEGLFIGLEGVLIIASTFALFVGHPGLVFGRQTAKGIFARDSSLERGTASQEK